MTGNALYDVSVIFQGSNNYSNGPVLPNLWRFLCKYLGGGIWQALVIYNVHTVYTIKLSFCLLQWFNGCVPSRRLYGISCKGITHM